MTTEVLTELPDVDGIGFTAVSSANAFGCGGTYSYDCDPANDNATTFIFPRLHSDEWLEGLEGQLEPLWPDRSGRIANSHPRAQEFAVPPGPVWDASWQGTRGEYVDAVKQHCDVEMAHHKQVAAALKQQRWELLTETLGGVAVDTYLPATFRVVHDVGCMCGHWTFSDGHGRVTMQVRDGRVYVCPDDVTIDEILETAARRSEDAAHDAKVSLTAQVEAFTQQTGRPYSRPDTDHDLTLTFAQWQGTRDSAEMLTRVRAAVVAQEWETVVALVRTLRSALYVTTPAEAAKRAWEKALNDADVTEISGEQAVELVAIVKPEASVSGTVTQDKTAGGNPGMNNPLR